MIRWLWRSDVNCLEDGKVRKFANEKLISRCMWFGEYLLRDVHWATRITNDRKNDIALLDKERNCLHGSLRAAGHDAADYLLASTATLVSDLEDRIRRLECRLEQKDSVFKKTRKRDK